MTNQRPKDADGNDPLPGQMDVYDVVSQIMADNAKAETSEERIHKASRERLARPMTPAEIVSARLRGKP